MKDSEWRRVLWLLVAVIVILIATSCGHIAARGTVEGIRNQAVWTVYRDCMAADPDQYHAGRRTTYYEGGMSRHGYCVGYARRVVQ